VRQVVARDEGARQRHRALSDLACALPSAEDLAIADCAIAGAVTTPDFHPGKPVPVGVVIDMVGGLMPHLIGNDIGCGMRLIALSDVKPGDLDARFDAHLRTIFFQGGRNIALTGMDRCCLLRDGIPGLLESLRRGRAGRGLLASADLEACWRDVNRTCDDGCFATTAVDRGFAEFAAIDDHHRHDAILGTIGGGNHFVEFGVVEGIADGPFAAAAGLTEGCVVVLVHSGSLDFGQLVGTRVREQLRQTVAAPDKRVLSVQQSPELADRYISAMGNAANAGFVNRFLIGLAAIEALRRRLASEHRTSSRL